MTLRWLVFLIAACGSGAGSVDVPVAPEPEPAQRVPGTPHSGQITLLATTEQGDAALTIDASGQARIWPMLDGSREPLIVHLPSVTELALARTADGLFAAAIDQAGGLELVRFDRTGLVVGRTRTAPEPGFAQVAALGDGVLALRRDQVVVRLDATGAERSSLAVPAGEHVETIAVRGGHVLVGLGGDVARSPGGPQGPAITRVRVLTTTQGLAWGALHTLRSPLVASTLALAPSGQWIAGLRADDGRAVLAIDAAAELLPLWSPSDRFSDDTFVGFIDDERLMVVDGSHVRWRTGPPARDPWETPNLDVQGSPAILAAANGHVVGARAMFLQLIEPHRTRYLGYRQLANQPPQRAVDGALIATRQQITWIDRDLAVQASRPLRFTDRAEVLAVGAEHVAVIDRSAGSAKAAPVYLDGGPTRPPILLGAWPDIGSLAYEPTTRVLAIPHRLSDGSTTLVERFEIDLTAHTSRRLSPLSVNATVNRVALLEPNQAHGLLAVAFAVDAQRGPTVVRFSDAPTSTGTHVPLVGDLDPLSGGGTELGIDRTGTAYYLRANERDVAVISARGKRRTITLLVLGDLFRLSGAVSPDGEAFVLYGNGLVVGVDATGKETWRLAPWQATSAEFLADGRTVVIGSDHGLLSLDRATGRRIARACAYGFSLSDTLPDLSLFSADNACSIDP